MAKERYTFGKHPQCAEETGGVPSKLAPDCMTVLALALANQTNLMLTEWVW